MDDLILAIGKDGTVKKYEETYATVEFKTEEDYNYFKDLLEKAQPKELLEGNTLVGKYKCPACGVTFIEGLGRTKYCGNCGQRLKWKDED